MTTYFAYGSNMHPDRMAVRCPGSEAVGVAALADHEVRIGHRGVATVVPSAGAVTFGVLWALTDDHVDTLDRVEGVHIGNYRREVIDVRSDDLTTDRIVRAMTYIEPFRFAAPPRDGYLEWIVGGASHFGLSTEYVARLAALAQGR